MTCSPDRIRRRGALNRGLPLATAVLVMASGCGRRSEEKPTPVPAVATPRADPPVPVPRFRSYPITTPKELLRLRDQLGAERFEDVLKLNRIDLRHARQGDTLVVPSAAEDWHDLAPFPIEWKEIAAAPKLVLVSLRLQVWAAYEDGRLQHWGPVSSGRRASPTLPGLYHTNWRQRERRSTFNGEWQLKWYVNLHNWNGISFHQYDLPGYPDSHACLRLGADDSEWMYFWCQSWVLSADQRTVLKEGTPVVVFGEYVWGERPWKRLPEDPSAGGLAPQELAAALRVWRDQVPPPPAPEAGPGR